MSRQQRYPKELREQAVRLVLTEADNYSSEWAAICSIAEKIGCGPETLRKWIRRAEVQATPAGVVVSEVQEQLRKLERENRELRRANEILRKASAYFAQAELDR